MKTLKELRAKSGHVFCKRVVGLNCIDDIPEMEKNLIDQLKEQNYDFKDWENTPNSWAFGCQFIRKPKLKRETEGFVVFRAGGDYTFSEDGKELSYGNKLAKENLTEYGFKVPVQSGEIQYHYCGPLN